MKFASHGALDSFAIIVNVETIITDKTEQSDAAFYGQFHGETGWRANGRDDGDARDGCLLYQFEAYTATDQQDSISQRDIAGHELAADELIEGVMPPYVFAQGDQFPA